MVFSDMASNPNMASISGKAFTSDMASISDMTSIYMTRVIFLEFHNNSVVF